MQSYQNFLLNLVRVVNFYKHFSVNNEANMNCSPISDMHVIVYIVDLA